MRKTSFIVLCVWTIIGCQTKPGSDQEQAVSSSAIKRDIDIQGHRGARGILPENSLRGFVKALDLGVNTLEMDLCITRDKQVIVSHEPYISSEICLDPDRNMLTAEKGRQLNIYEMDYSEIQEYDCGSLMHPRFPSQGKVKTLKPLLSQVFRRVENHVQSSGYPPVRYNIELKSSEEYDDVYHPAPAEFCQLVFDQIDGKIDWSRVTIQSFDFRILQYFRENYPQVQLSQLIENRTSWEQNIADLGFKPDIYSCDYNLLSAEIVKGLQAEGIKVIPWTVNEVEDMKRLIEWGVDGIITDYPDRTQQLEI